VIFFFPLFFSFLRYSRDADGSFFLTSSTSFDYSSILREEEDFSFPAIRLNKRFFSPLPTFRCCPTVEYTSFPLFSLPELAQNLFFQTNYLPTCPSPFLQEASVLTPLPPFPLSGAFFFRWLPPQSAVFLFFGGRMICFFSLRPGVHLIFFPPRGKSIRVKAETVGLSPPLPCFEDMPPISI